MSAQRWCKACDRVVPHDAVETKPEVDLGLGLLEQSFVTAGALLVHGWSATENLVARTLPGKSFRCQRCDLITNPFPGEST